jgi:cytochrome P450
MNLDEIDFRNPDLYLRGTPHELFTRLRHEDPVHWNAEKDGRGFWSIAKYDDITAISKNPRLFSSAREHGGHRMFDENVVGVAGVGAEETDAPMISMDPPEHNRYRRMLSPGFSPSRLRPLEERIEASVLAILDRLGNAANISSCPMSRHNCQSRSSPNCLMFHKRIGNETTRNSLSSGVVVLAQFPEARRRLIENPVLMRSAVAGIVRYVSPVTHTRRTALADTELRGKQIWAGDKPIWSPRLFYENFLPISSA